MAPGISLDDSNAWDDSALIDSWDEAVAEYQKYHSIQAQGKRLEDVLSAEELKQLKEEEGDLVEDVETESLIADRNSHADVQNADNAEAETIRDPHATPSKEASAAGPQEPSRTAETQLPPQDGALAASMPQAILGSVQDEELKNVMMAWYYAGYYTGLYTGQQQAGSSDARQRQ